MENLYKGIHKFKKSYFKKKEDFFKRLSAGQSPEVFFITCADSRVDPNLVTQTRPGELFILRNIGNLVPPYDAIKDKNSVAAAIEFAVLGLKVKDIIICGHSNCGAMDALNHINMGLDSMPHLKDWLKLALPVVDIVKENYPDRRADALSRITEEENVLVQLKNIQTYPFVEEQLKKGQLYLHGWHYDIATGSVCAYNPERDLFESIV